MLSKVLDVILPSLGYAGCSPLALARDGAPDVSVPSGSCPQLGIQAASRISHLKHFRNEIVFQASGTH